MTVTTEENLAADEYYAAEDPPDEDVSAGQDFTEEAPFGWMRDPKTKELRPKKSPGRPKTPPGAEELASAPEVERTEDRPPTPGKPPKGDVIPPMPRGGVIAKGVNRLYRRAGKIVRAMDADIGEAIIECTYPDEGDLSVGEAWENLCKANPRIRAFVLNALKGGAWGDLLMAHLPIGLALFMKPAVQRLLPFNRLVESVAEPDEDTPEGEGGLPGGMTLDDAGEVGDLIGSQAERMARKAANAAGVTLTEEDLAEARKMAGEMMSGNVPPGFRRQQPKRSTRAGRKR